MVVSTDCPVARFLSEILALETTAPEGLVIVPERVADESCAFRGGMIPKKNASIKTDEYKMADRAFKQALLKNQACQCRANPTTDDAGMGSRDVCAGRTT